MKNIKDKTKIILLRIYIYLISSKFEHKITIKKLFFIFF